MGKKAVYGFFAIICTVIVTVTIAGIVPSLPTLSERLFATLMLTSVLNLLWYCLGAKES